MVVLLVAMVHMCCNCWFKVACHILSHYYTLYTIYYSVVYSNDMYWASSYSFLNYFKCYELIHIYPSLYHDVWWNWEICPPGLNWFLFSQHIWQSCNVLSIISITYLRPPSTMYYTLSYNTRPPSTYYICLMVYHHRQANQSAVSQVWYHLIWLRQSFGIALNVCALYLLFVFRCLAGWITTWNW